ncbi:hypothetical protein NA56DRAFT_717906 [Hyaloscypha hepaticicola]|uniref:Uncharacterized protein n=1 Tax=Hyaloscypha hepaticicola TaxID=2082293 RepID=A0A2J6Q9F2_9HELO|nr:hypothetical protein NA56DRAFT_717906 [Hyaloscypha hepaticicola]
MCNITIDAFPCLHGKLAIHHCEKRAGVTKTITQWEDLVHMLHTLFTDANFKATLKCLDAEREIKLVPLPDNFDECLERRGPCNKQHGDTKMHYLDHDGKEVHENNTTVTHDHKDKHPQTQRRGHEDEHHQRQTRR